MDTLHSFVQGPIITRKAQLGYLSQDWVKIVSSHKQDYSRTYNPGISLQEHLSHTVMAVLQEKGLVKPGKHQLVCQSYHP